MAIYYHCFDSSFSIMVVVSFGVAFVLFGNVILCLLLMVSKKPFIFTITDRKIFSKLWKRECKGLFKNWHGPTNVFFRD